MVVFQTLSKLILKAMRNSNGSLEGDMNFFLSPPPKKKVFHLYVTHYLLEIVYIVYMSILNFTHSVFLINMLHVCSLSNLWLIFSYF